MGAAARKLAVELLDCSEVVLDGVRFLGCTLWTDYSLAPQGERSAVVEAARKLNPDYQLIRCGSRAFAPGGRDRALRPAPRLAGRGARHAFPWKNGRHHPLRAAPALDRALLCGSSRQPRVRCGSRGNDGERRAVDPRTHAHVFRLQRGRHAGDLQTRAAIRTNRPGSSPT